MDEKNLRLRDYIRINTDVPSKSMIDSEILNLKDSSGIRKRGLLVTFDLSHSGRRINNRIYPPWGQRDGAGSWTNPFPRAVILDHNPEAKNVIGRFVSVEWKSLEQEAINHLGDIKAYLEIKKSFDSQNPKHIYKVYNKYGLFQDKAWPGLGKLEAKALITDEDAIQRFLDGRYLTFSAGSRTNAYTCLVCASDWHSGDICDHRPGLADEEGNVAYFMTGLFLGDEGSVVTGPADDYSQVRNLELQDLDTSIFVRDAEIVDVAGFYMNQDTESFIFTDSKMEVASMGSIEFKDLVELDTETVVTKVLDGTLEINLEDLTGDTQLEIQWLIQVHDQLHYRYDYVLRGLSETKPENIPTGIFAMHGKIHDLSTQKGFRDSITNGELDGFDTQGAPSEEYMIQRPATDSDLSGLFNQLKDSIMSELKEVIQPKTNVNETVPEVQNADAEIKDADEDSASAVVQQATSEKENQEDKEQKEVESEVSDATLLDQIKALLQEDQEPLAAIESLKGLVADESDPEFVDDETIDWFVLDMALDSAVGDAKLSAEARKKLSKGSFCGPDRSFPVPDCAHVTAARRLIGRAKLSSDQKAKVLACVNRKAKSMSCDTSDSVSSTDFNDLNQDYVTALTTIDELKSQVNTLKDKLTQSLEAHATALKADISDVENQTRLDSLQAWFDKIEPVSEVTEDSNPLEHIKEVENPSADSSEGKEITRKLKLGDFEKNIVDEYIRKRDEEGQEQADRFLFYKRRYLPKTFDLTKYIK